MAEQKKTIKEAVGDFISNHPFLTFFTVTSLIEAPAALVKALKWDGHYADNIYQTYQSSDNESASEVEESE